MTQTRHRQKSSCCSFHRRKNPSVILPLLTMLFRDWSKGAFSKYLRDLQSFVHEEIAGPCLGLALMGSRSESDILYPWSSPITVHSPAQGPHHLHMVGIACSLQSLWLQYFKITMFSLSNSAGSNITLGS